MRANQQAGLGFLSPMPGGSVNYGMPAGSGVSVAPPNTGAGLGMGYGYGAYFPNPYGGNIFKGLPTSIGQTPYGPMLSQLQQYNYNPNQLRTIAGQQTQATIGSQLGASYANQTAEQAVLAAQQNRASGLAAALGNFGPDYASAMQNAYTQAAGTMAAVGPGVVSQGAGDMSSALDAAKAQVAAKTGGQGQVSSYDPAALASTLSTTGVQMPGNALALQGYNAAQMGLYGAMADKGQVQGVAQYYQQQAVNALQQRTAERASIIAQQPQLYQQALEQQRQDEYQTQDRIMNTIGAGSQYIASRMGLALQRAQVQGQYGMELAKMTGVNPYTQQPMPGYTPITLADGRTVVVPFNQAAQAAHWGSQAAYWNQIGGARVTSANAATTRAQAAGQQYNPQLSAQVGHLVDNNRQAIPNSATGGTIPYTSTSIGNQAYDPKLSAQVHHLVTKGGQAILVNGQTMPYSPTAAASTTNAATGGIPPSTAVSDQTRIQNQIASWFTGSPGTPWLYRPTDTNADKNGFIYKPGTSVAQLGYKDALKKALQMAPSKTWRARVTQWVNDKYSDPNAIHINAQQAFSAGTPYQQALQTLKSHYSPSAPLEQILQQVYYGGPYSPIAGSASSNQPGGFGSGQTATVTPTTPTSPFGSSQTSSPFVP
jgi:hypothetical protein